MASRFVKVFAPIAQHQLKSLYTPSFRAAAYSTKKFTKDHEWLEINGDVATIGITDHARSELGEIVFVELKDVGSVVEREDEVGTVESVKAVSEIYAPVSGEVVEINNGLLSDTSALNEDPEKEGWLVKMRLSDDSQVNGLMDESAYKSFIETSKE